MADIKNLSLIQTNTINEDIHAFLPSNIETKLNQIPKSNGSRYYKKLNLTIGIIADETMYNYYKDSANFYYINYQNYKEIINNNKIDLFLFVTLWHGQNKDWTEIIRSQQKKQELHQIIDYLKDKNIPTIFQSIEESSHYSLFIDIAKDFDYIFTTAEDDVPRYKKDCNHQNVWHLEHGINPYIHNPIGFRNYKLVNNVVYSGKLMINYKDRCKDLERILDGVLESGYKLTIFDQNQNCDLNLPLYSFISSYNYKSNPPIKYETLIKIHKLFNWSISFNDMIFNEATCPRRIYELQALGTNVITNYNREINNNFPNIFMIHNKNEVASILSSFTEDELYKHQLKGIRNVFSNNTVYDRLYFILDKIGMKHEHRIPKILVLTNSITPKVQEMFERQTYTNKKLELTKNVTLEIYNEFDVIAFFNSGMTYYEYYLEDMVNGFKYTDSDYITKDCYFDGDQFIEGVEHDYVSKIKNKYATIFWREAFALYDILTLENNTNRYKGYSIDRFELNDVYKRKMSNANKNYKLSVIIPIYNNGHLLLDKCFNSLIRSNMFEEMEIILVDDASTDKRTPMIMKRIAREYPNVKTYFFKGKASGSASLPRNKGIELASAPYLAFADPDNETVNDGYSKLYKETTDKELDVIIGNMKLSNTNRVINYFQDEIIHYPRKFHINSKFKIQNIQALIVKKDLVQRNHLNMVVGAAGQDTLFFIEIMLVANKAKCINETILVYYVHVRNSMLNSINKNYFKKKLILELEAKQRFEKYNVLLEYQQYRFERFFKNWYLIKLRLIDLEDARECIDILFKIYEIYSENLILKEPKVIDFITLCKKRDYQTIINKFILPYKK